MADLEIQIQGVPALVEKLGRAAAMQTLRAPMVRAIARLQGRLQDYPDPPEGSSYVRTGDLGRSWTSAVEDTGGGLVGSLGNAVRSRRTGRPYAVYVQHDPSFPAPHQAGHMSHWSDNTDLQALDQERGAIEADFRNTIDDALSI